MAQRLNLHDALKRQRFDHAVICTFTFEPQFFEGYCLDRFKSLADNNNISVLLDRRVYDSLLDCPASEWPRQANIRYLLHPIQVPGVFHPKIVLLVSKDKGLLVVGSANFTKAGITTNAELVGVYEFELGKRDTHIALFRQATAFLLALLNKWPSPDLESNLHDMIGEADWLVGEQEANDPQTRFIHNLEQPLWTQICEGLTGPVDGLHALSRYFDSEPTLLRSIRQRLVPKKTTLWTQSGITTMTPAWFADSAVRAGKVLIRDCSVFDGEHPQPLHAKAIAITQGKAVRLAFGSANFSRAGLLSTAASGNVETMVVVDNLSHSACNPNRLFDPSATAKNLTSVDQLGTAVRDELPISRQTDVVLSYAGLIDRHLQCCCSSAKDLANVTAMTAVVTFGDGGENRLALQRDGAGYSCELSDQEARRCGDGVTVVHVEARLSDASYVRSNQVFLANLQDIETGRGQRRERRIREAMQSAAQFASVLQELLQSSDADQLQNFLTYCDIPMIDAPRPPWARGARPPWQDLEAMRTLGQRNLRAYASLHDAAIGFCERHLRRMRRHCDRVSVAGIPNFLHIALSVSNVLRAQVERLLVGLELATTPLSIDEWYDHRQRLNQYLSGFRDVMQIIDAEYLPKLRRRFKAQAIRDAIQPDLQPLTDICAVLRQTRNRIEACRARNLRVLRPSGEATVPGVPEYDMIHEKRWSDWDETIRRALERTSELRQATA